MRHLFIPSNSLTNSRRTTVQLSCICNNCIKRSWQGSCIEAHTTEHTQHKVDNTLHDQSDDLDKFMKQLKLNYINLASSNERIKNLEEQKLVSEAKLEMEKSNSAQAMKAVQQIAEQNCQEHQVPINASLQ
jgi:hypothetical protein